jgi:hypothetical protein
MDLQPRSTLPPWVEFASWVTFAAILIPSALSTELVADLDEARNPVPRLEATRQRLPAVAADS